MPDLAAAPPIRIHAWFELLMDAVQAKPKRARDLLLHEFVTMALFEPGQEHPVPVAIVREFMARSDDADLPMVLCQLVRMWLWLGQAYTGQARERHDCSLLRKLPRGLRLLYLVAGFNGEVLDEGFWAFFVSSEGKFAEGTLEDCRLVGARRHADLLEKAIAVWAPAERRIKAAGRNRERQRRALDFITNDINPELWKLDCEFRELDDQLQKKLTKYLRQHPDQCIAAPSASRRKGRKKNR